MKQHFLTFLAITSKAQATTKTKDKFGLYQHLKILLHQRVTSQCEKFHRMGENLQIMYMIRV